MISIGSDLNRAHRNALATLFFRRWTEMGPRKLFGEPQRPPQWGVRGRGGWRAISRLQTKLRYYTVLYKNDGVLNIGPARDGYRERAERLARISADRN